MMSTFSSYVIYLRKCGLPLHCLFLFICLTLMTREDGVQLALPLLISASPSEASISQFLFTAWYIWKVPNENCFHRKTPTSF
jgi:hypothetical protein